MSTQELVRYEQPEELTPQQVKGQVQRIQQLMKEAMQEDEHYGVIPGTRGKPTLLKPGAEKLCLMFRMDPEYEILRAVEEPNRIHYVVKCTLYHSPSGNRISSGLGSCNSWESKYRYRKADRVCPKCGVAAIIKGKDEYGGGWLCFKKKDGCGAKFKDGDDSIESQEAGQLENPDPWDQANTIIKMASKRALVAAVLNGTAASDIFTQDLEDMEPGTTPVASKPKAESATTSGKAKAEQPERAGKYQLDEAELEEARDWLDMPDCEWVVDVTKKPPLTMAGLLRSMIKGGASSKELVQRVLNQCRDHWADKAEEPPTVDITDDDIPF